MGDLIRFHEDGSQAAEDEIFVFGSNEAGIHGAGAARAAYRFYGAAWGYGFGLAGRSFAIPTKDRGLETLSLTEIIYYVHAFKSLVVKNVQERLGLKFFVTRVGCGLAGYRDEQIAHLFFGFPYCSFAEEWRPYVVDDAGVFPPEFAGE